MSDVQTSPEPTDVAAESAEVASAESPEPSGSETETSGAVEATADSADTVFEETPEKKAETSAYDPASWDGNIDSLPPELQEPVRFLHKNLESGYTKKFQSLSDAKKTFDADREKWTAERDEWEKQRDDLVSERDLLKQLMDGGEDPRISDLTGKYEKAAADLARTQADFEDFRRLVEEDIDVQAADYAEKFYQEHKEIFDNEDHAKQLDALLDQEWEPEIAVKLLFHPEEALKLANDLRSKGTPQSIAAEHAIMKHGTAKTRKPRPSAKITAGAESANNPAVSRAYTDFGTNATDARMAAATAAMNWRKRSDLK
tara:strand:- start:11171 stop:12115 length:945 start_codon:yes stop_codon:yes gene_type:complete